MARGHDPGKGGDKAMDAINPMADGKSVYVREYLRFRYGRWEEVTSHFRRPPQ